jgi:hypothetical protein
MVSVVQRAGGEPTISMTTAAGRLTREPRYRVVLDLAVDNLAAGMPVVLVAPFTAERADPAAWAATRTG